MPKDKTVVEALASAGVETRTSCEQGVCGKWVARVLEAEPGVLRLDCAFKTDVVVQNSVIVELKHRRTEADALFDGVRTFAGPSS